jgi:hypothetical protein
MFLLRRVPFSALESLSREVYAYHGAFGRWWVSDGVPTQSTAPRKGKRESLRFFFLRAHLEEALSLGCHNATNLFFFPRPQGMNADPVSGAREDREVEDGAVWSARRRT